MATTRFGQKARFRASGWWGYWAESAVIGFFNFFKILLAGKQGLQREPRGLLPLLFGSMFFVGKLFLAAFFLVHFGMFMAAHGVFLFVLVLRGGLGGGAPWPPDLAAAFYEVRWVLFGFFVSHAFSFWKNFLAGGESLKFTAREIMGQPYSRIIVMHITILAGAFLMAATGTNRSFLAVFLVMKTFLDLKGHLGERKKAAQASTAVNKAV